MKFLSIIEEYDIHTRLGAIISSKRKLKTDTGEYLLEILEYAEPTYHDRIVEAEVRAAHGFVLMYSLQSKSSCEALKMIKSYISRYTL